MTVPHLELDVQFRNRRDTRLLLMGTDITPAVTNLQMNLDADQQYAMITMEFRAVVNTSPEAIDSLLARQEIVALRRELAGVERKYWKDAFEFSSKRLKIRLKELVDRLRG